MFFVFITYDSLNWTLNNDLNHSVPLPAQGKLVLERFLFSLLFLLTPPSPDENITLFDQNGGPGAFSRLYTATNRHQNTPRHRTRHFYFQM